MSTKKILAFTVIAVFAVLVMFDSAMALSVTDQDVKSLVKQAKTPEDHLKLAAYYTEKAKEMDEEASNHRELAKEYADYAVMSAGVKHCQTLSAIYEKAAEEYRSMATVHIYLSQGK